MLHSLSLKSAIRHLWQVNPATHTAIRIHHYPLRQQRQDRTRLLTPECMVRATRIEKSGNDDDEVGGTRNWRERLKSVIGEMFMGFPVTRQRHFGHVGSGAEMQVHHVVCQGVRRELFFRL